MMAPVDSSASKKRAEEVTGARVMPSTSDCTKVSPATSTMMPEAMICAGEKLMPKEAATLYKMAAGKTAKKPPTTF